MKKMLDARLAMHRIYLLASSTYHLASVSSFILHPSSFRIMPDPIIPSYEGDFDFAEDRPFQLFSGGKLQPVRLRYAIYGKLNERRDNVILVCHALTGSARVGDWWPQLF